MANELPNQLYLLECFNYSREHGKLVWCKRPRHHFKSERDTAWWNLRFSGTEPVNKDKDGYYRVGLDGKTLKVHRVIWKIVTGLDPVGVIDHVNGVVSDNRFENLRDVTQRENSLNRLSAKGRNKTGFRGVIGTRTVIKKYQGVIEVNRKKVYGLRRDTPQEAHEDYLNLAQKYHGDFAPTQRTYE
jgi:hypothetical protein